VLDRDGQPHPREHGPPPTDLDTAGHLVVEPVE